MEYSPYRGLHGSRSRVVVAGHDERQVVSLQRRGKEQRELRFLVQRRHRHRLYFERFPRRHHRNRRLTLWWNPRPISAVPRTWPPSILQRQSFMCWHWSLSFRRRVQLQPRKPRRFRSPGWWGPERLALTPERPRRHQAGRGHHRKLWRAARDHSRCSRSRRTGWAGRQAFWARRRLRTRRWFLPASFQLRSSPRKSAPSFSR